MMHLGTHRGIAASMRSRGRRMHALSHSVVAIATLVGLTGCSIQKLATTALADAIAESGSVYASDDDVELVGAATPFGLKTIEGLLAALPHHEGLLLAAAKGYTQYSYAYVDLPSQDLEFRDVQAAYEQKDRARRLYLRARDYGLRALEVRHPGFIEQLPGSVSSATSREDVPYLYWTGAALAGAISLGKDDADLIAQIPVLQRLMERALELEPTFDDGALHTFFIAYEMNRPNAGTDRIQRALAHFRLAVELTNRQQAAPYVVLAESVAVAEQDRARFESLLGEALDIDAYAVERWTLANILMQRRARWLLEHRVYFFSN